MNVIQAIRDPQLFRPFLADHNDSLRTWHNWEIALRCLYGLPVKKAKNLALVERCTGRTTLPADGFQQALFLTGRRSGKSRIAAVICATEAICADLDMLARGETGVCAVVSPTRRQSLIVKNYLRAIFDTTPLLRQEVTRETREGFQLRNGISIEILVADFRMIRGHSVVCCVCDEVAYMGLDEDSKVHSDTELIRAVLPSLATTGGKLVCISSPYARRGWTWQTYQKHHNNSGSILVWNTDSRTMNPTLSQKIIDAAMQEDLAAAKSEYLGEFRDDVSLLVPLEVIERCVVKGRFQLMPRPHTNFQAFCDLSGGRHDDGSLAIGHRDGDKAIIDCLKRYAAPFDPRVVIGAMAQVLHSYGIRAVVGDRYAGSFVSEGFRSHGISYLPSPKSKSELFIDLLGRLASPGSVELLDDDVSVKQIGSLERRTRSGGKDSVDHPPGGHDDLANSIAGVIQVLTRPTKRIGGWATRGQRTADPRATFAKWFRNNNVRVLSNN